MDPLDGLIRDMRMSSVTIGLKPLDVLVYAPRDLWGQLIAFGTGVYTSHVATYLGNGKSAEARGQSSENIDGKRVKGVDTFPLRLETLTHVLRPVQAPTQEQIDKALAWHESVRGQGYDLIGFRVFLIATLQGNNGKQFCSEHAARMARVAALKPFRDGFDADRIKPGDFLKSPAYYVKYRITWDGGIPHVEKHS